MLDRGQLHYTRRALNNLCIHLQVLLGRLGLKYLTQAGINSIHAILVTH